MKKLLLIVCSCFALLPVIAQMNFYFIPEVNGISIDGLGMFQVQNLSANAVSGRIGITITETKSRTVAVQILTPGTTFSTGMQVFPKAVFSKSSFAFPDNTLGALINQTRSFPPGEYEYCFKFIPADKSTAEEAENCFTGIIEPLVPISLIYPGDQDRLCNTRPMLSWQPPVPYRAGMQFRLILTEKKEKESALESIMTKAPLVFVDRISSTSINFPAGSPSLKEGKTYCWQVIAYQQGFVISKSEIWEFTVQCKEPSVQTENDSYRELKSMVNGNYYITDGMIKFSFNNNYNLKKLNYTILDVENGRKPVKHLPEVEIKPGLNKIDIDISELQMQPGGHYVLKVMPFNEEDVEIRFVYSENSTSK